MIYVNSIMEAVFNVLANDPPLSGQNIEVGELVNRDQGRLPWIGIWPGGTQVDPFLITGGLPQGWRAEVDVQVYHQSYNETMSGSVGRDLAAVQQKIFTAVASNTQLSGATDTLMSISSEVVEGDPNEEVHFQTNLITLTYQVEGQ